MINLPWDTIGYYEGARILLMPWCESGLEGHALY